MTDPRGANALAHVDLFSSLSTETVDHLTREAIEARFEAGRVVLRRGEGGSAMYVIREGTIEIRVCGEDGTERFRAELGPGQVFGEMALLTDEPRSADVVATTDCRCLVVRRELVLELMGRHAELASLLTTLVGERLRSGGGIRRVGKYRLVGEIGRGSMGVVFEGIHPELERAVAVKMLAHELVYRPHFAERFRSEARLVAELSHPNVVQVYDTEEAYHTIFIVMEKVKGPTLEELLESRGPLPADLVREIVSQIASALDHAHRRGIVHRDVKPANVMLDAEQRAKLTDFGLAFTTGGGVTESGAGTPRYMAPEALEGGPVDARSDLYALGILTFELLTGRPPFTGGLMEVFRAHLESPLPRIGPEVPADLRQLVEQATVKKPAERIGSAREVLDLLGHRSSDLGRVGLETLTLLFDQRREDEVARLVERWRREVAGLPGVELR